MNDTTQESTFHLPTRLRRLRQHPRLRDLVRETSLSVNDLVFPLFIRHGENQHIELAGMPGLAQISIDNLPQEIEAIEKLNIPAVMLFGIPEQKDEFGSDSMLASGIMQQAIQTIREIAPDLLVMSDICFCEYTDHGHCGYIPQQTGETEVHNDITLELLVKQALSHATAGAQVLAPSGMMDGAVHAIRSALDETGFEDVVILHHSAKYCSSLYGPFAEATEGAPQFGDRKTYQMDPANRREALREVNLDVEEGVDIVMIKPASIYLDVIQNVRQNFPEIPIAAYHVSGEFSMIKAAAQKGWLDERKVALETLTSIKRAGADFIITYYAKEVAKWLSE